MYTSCVRHAHGMLAPRTLHSRATYTPRTHPALAAYTACTHGTHSMHMRRARLAHPGHTPCTCQSPTHTCAMRAPCIPHATHAILASSGHSCTPRATRATARTLLACALVSIRRTHHALCRVYPRPCRASGHLVRRLCACARLRFFRTLRGLLLGSGSRSGFPLSTRSASSAAAHASAAESSVAQGVA